jgi:hypothetical protein
MSTLEETRQAKLSEVILGAISKEFLEQRTRCEEVLRLWHEKMMSPQDNGQEYFLHYAYSFFSFHHHYDTESEEAVHSDEWEFFYKKVSLSTRLIVWLGTNVGYATFTEALSEYQKNTFTSGCFSAHLMLAGSRGQSPLHLFDIALFDGKKKATREEIEICLVTLSFFEMDEGVKMMEQAHQKIFPPPRRYHY